MIRLRQAWDRRVRVAIRTLVLLILISAICTVPAQAQPAPPNHGKTQGASIDPNSNPMSGWATRENYFKRMPFAKNAYDHDEKSVVHRGTVENAGNTSFLDGLFGGGEDDFTSLFGGGENPTQQPPVERLQRSDPPAEGETVQAYPFYIKFCNDNPYQGVCYWQFGEAVDTPAAARDMELFENVLTTFGYPVSDTQFQIIQRENFQRLLELLFDPERNTWMMTNTAQIGGASASNSLASGSENAWNTCLEYIMNGADGTGVLINVANENSATPINNPNVLYKQVSEAVYMVQRMYREVFVPMAILFLLPGAVVTQVKATVRQGFNLEQTPNPFEGILRSVIAVFLIPATQVIVSYSIDVGNSMADAVKEWVDVELIMEWSHELTYNVTPQNHKNVISPPEAQGGANNGGGGVLSSIGNALGLGGGGAGGAGGGGGGGGAGGGGGFMGAVNGFVNGFANGFVNGIINYVTGWIGSVFNGVGSWFAGLFGDLMAPFVAAFDGLFGSGGDGIAANIPETSTIHEDQLALSQVFQAMVNGTVFFVSLSIIMLTAFQLVFMCYLFLLGPLSAAMFAWPIVHSTGYFRAVFSKWVEAVICLSLWRFYWLVALAIMTQRLIYLGGSKWGTGDLQWEAIIFCCALGLMLFSAMNPFIYDPARAGSDVERTVQTGKSMGGGGGGGGGGDAGGGGQQAGSSSGGTVPPSAPSQGAQSATVAPTSGGSSAGPEGGSSSDDQPPPVTVSSRASLAPDSGGSGPEGGSDSAPPSADASRGPDSPSPQTAPPPSASAEGAGAARDGGAGDGGGSAGSSDLNAPPLSADAGAGGGGAGGDAGGDAGLGDGGGAAAASSSTGLPSQEMASSGPPVSLSGGPPMAMFNGSADAQAIASAGSSAVGAAGGGSGDSGAGGSMSLSVDVSGGGEDSGGSPPSQAAPPVPPPPSMDDDE